MENLKKTFSKIKINRGGRFLGMGLNPEIDWKLMLITFFFIASTILTFCAYYFIKVNSGDFDELTAEENIPVSTFNINRVRQTVNYYQNKSVELEKIKTNPENILDPSI